MAVPGSNPIQLMPAGPAEFYVDTMTDPNGAPANVIDVDQGFKVSGRVTLPNWLTGKGHVAIYADELGGPIDKKIGQTNFDITASVGEPQLKTYHWHVNFPGNPPVLPDPSPGSQLYRLAAVFTFGDQSTDIAAFVEMGLFLIN
jgi:hypothetical protein